MSFTFLFYKHIMFRKSCGKCHFTNLKRPSDITIADFWGWEKNVPGFNDDDKGCSLILVNTEKGRKLFEAVRERMSIIQVEPNNCLQPNMQHPSQIHPKRNQFEREYAKKGFEYVYFKYGEDGWRNKLSVAINKIKKVIKRLIRRK